MSEYRLQIELCEEAKREVVLHSEKSILQKEIQDHKRKISKKLIAYGNISAFLIMFNAVIDFISPGPFDFMFFWLLAIAYSIELIWLSHGLRKRRRNLEEWQRLVAEAEIQTYINQ